MNHASTIKKLGRERGQRIALMQSLAEALILHGSIKTTEAKAKALRPYVEKLVSTARPGSVASRRLVLARLGNREKAAEMLSNTVAPKFKEREGGYTRIIKVSRRKSDAAPLAIIQFVE
jgi:large subunit ribosomal protein L17